MLVTFSSAQFGPLLHFDGCSTRKGLAFAMFHSPLSFASTFFDPFKARKLPAYSRSTLSINSVLTSFTIHLYNTICYMLFGNVTLGNVNVFVVVIFYSLCWVIFCSNLIKPSISFYFNLKTLN